MKLFDKIKKSKLFQKRSGAILLSFYALLICSISAFAALETSSQGEMLPASEEVSVVDQQKDTEVQKDKAKDKAKETSKDKETDKANADKNDSKDSKHEVSHSSSKPSKKPGSSHSSKKVWVEPVYETIEHPAVTRREKVIVGYRCMCGREFATTGEYQAHRPIPCDGKHSAYDPIYEIRTVVIKEAWTETVLVKEGYWKEV